MKDKNHIGGSLFEGLSASWPVCLGYIPIGIAFGILAQKAGFTPFETGFMSLPVYFLSGRTLPGWFIE